MPLPSRRLRGPELVQEVRSEAAANSRRASSLSYRVGCDQVIRVHRTPYLHIDELERDRRTFVEASGVLQGYQQPIGVSWHCAMDV
jgi:hypothetical protein